MYLKDTRRPMTSAEYIHNIEDKKIDGGVILIIYFF